MQQGGNRSDSSEAGDEETPMGFSAIELEFMYPGVMSGGEAISITKDEEPVRTLPLHSSVVETTLQAEPWQMVHLQFDYNFYMQNAREQRGQDRLAAIVHITTP